eukprot:gene19193-biopygen19813
MARVRVDDQVSKPREFLEGFPQGTVLGPLCWDIFVDDVVDCLKLPAGAVVEIYADDIVAILTGPSVAELTRRAQLTLDSLARWEIQNKALVSLEKSTVTLFTPRPASASVPVPQAQRPKLWYPDRSLPPPQRGKRTLMKYDANPKLLGIVYDEALTFARQATLMKEKLASRRRVTARLAGTTWGQDTSTLRALHLAYTQSRMDYGLAAYGPFLTSANVHSKLQAEQYKAACTVSGCSHGTSTAVALAEAHLMSAEQRIDFAAAVMHQRCIRLPAGNGARDVAERADPPNPRRPSTWRSRARRVAAPAELPAEVEPLATHSRADPWDGAGEVDFHAELKKKVRKKKNTPEQLRAAALETLAQLPPATVEAYTDGSVLDPRKLRTGGGGYVLNDGNGKQHSGRCAAGELCTSYLAELRAVKQLLDDLLEPATPIAVPMGAEIRIGLDSQSAIRSLQKGPTAQEGMLEMTVWDCLTAVSRRYKAHITIQYVPGHVGVDAQEEADRVAKEAASSCPQERIPATLGMAQAAIRGVLRGRATDSLAPDHVWMQCTGGTPPALDHSMPREAQRRLAQLRSGHCRLLASWLFHIPGGCIITEVRPESPAAKAGLSAGWRVDEVDGAPATTDAEIRAALARARGATAKLQVREHLSPACPTGCGEVDSLKHLVIECPGYAAARHSAFATHSPPL